MKHPFTGVILAGGLNKRFSGKEKALIEIDGVRILDRILAVFEKHFSEIILVTNHPLRYLPWNVQIVSDLYPIRSALTGIHTGLFYATCSHAFFSASDTPFLTGSMVELILEKAQPHIDIVIPETSAGLEPLCAVYSKRRLPVIETHLKENNLKIRGIFNGARVRKVSESELRRQDPTLLSFININTPEDLDTARALPGERDIRP